MLSLHLFLIHRNIRDFQVLLHHCKPQNVYSNLHILLDITHSLMSSGLRYLDLPYSLYRSFLLIPLQYNQNLHLVINFLDAHRSVSYLLIRSSVILLGIHLLAVRSYLQNILQQNLDKINLYQLLRYSLLLIHS